MKSLFALSALALLAVANAGYCPNGYTGFLYAEDCTKFYYCNSGHDNILVCPPPLYFDGERCEHPERVDGCEDGRRSGGLPVNPVVPEPQPDPEETQPEPQPEPNPEPSEPETQPEPQPEEPSEPAPQPEEPSEPAPQPEEPSEPAPQPGDGNVSCPNAPFYYIAVPNNSNTFYVCQNGQLSGTSKCSPDLVFNQDKQACVR